MTPRAQRQEWPALAVDATTVRDVLGDPVAWPFCISDDQNGIPHLRGATIQDIFVTQRRLYLYMQETSGCEAVAVFFIDDQDLLERTALALRSEADLLAALNAPL